ncbi:MAG TPA: DUF1360 domain-containing protein [Phycisphaerales bacterium]|nr:DUF1360 domain-containing protein [Phycisphaerales bacterium]HMP37768.1 DUF1360 domain-containing protein [Phycisphaerales bacterium]
MLESPWLRLLMGTLATWRIVHLVVHEDGPWDLVLRLRRRAGSGTLGRAMDCPWCLGIWVSAGMAPLVAWAPSRWPEWAAAILTILLAWWGIAGGAALIEHLGGRRSTGSGAVPHDRRNGADDPGSGSLRHGDAASAGAVDPPPRRS